MLQQMNHRSAPAGGAHRLRCIPYSVAVFDVGLSDLVARDGGLARSSLSACGVTYDEMETNPAEQNLRVATRLGHLHVRIVGPDELPTAVLWPSMFSDGHAFERVVPLLNRHRRLVIVDPPGLGKSDPLGVISDIDGVAGAAMDLLMGLDLPLPVDWVGEAFGGHVGYKLARDPKVLRSLVAISAPPETNPELLRMTRVLLAVVGIVGRRPVTSLVASKQVTPTSLRDPTVAGVVRRAFLANTRRSLVNATRSFILGRRDVRSELPDIAVPTLIAATTARGEWTVEGAKAAAALIPGARLATIDGASANSSLEQPQATAGVILKFWEGSPEC